MQLFTIEKICQQDDTHIFRATLDATHRVFEGHFPENPVVPGVCSMEMIKRCCRGVIGADVRFDTVKEVKFLSAIIPSQHRELEVIIDFKSAMDIAVLVKSEQTTMLKLRATLI